MQPSLLKDCFSLLQLQGMSGVQPYLMHGNSEGQQDLTYFTCTFHQVSEFLEMCQCYYFFYPTLLPCSISLPHAYL